MRHAIIAALTFATLACAQAPTALPATRAAPPAARFRPEDAPPTLAPAVARADAAIQALRGRLGRRLSEELAGSGPAGAVNVCRDEAPAIRAEVAGATGVEVGRTSERLRNPANAPRPWMNAVLAESAGKRASEVQAIALDLGDRVGVARPIVVATACLACHGAPERLSPAVEAALQASYPGDRATGYEEGDLRGFFWAEAKK